MKKKKILCVCMSATYQRTVVFEKLLTAKVNRAEHYNLYASGKAVNAARVISQLQKDSVITVCPLGKQNSTEFIKLAQQDGLGLYSIETPGKIRECWTLLDTRKKTTTELVVGEPVPEEDFSSCEIKLLRLITDKLEDCEALLLAGSRQGKWSPDIYAVICGIALDKGKTVLADFIGSELLAALKTAVPSIIKINDDEFKATFKLEANEQNICKKSREFNNIIIVTRGSDSTLAAERGTFYECPSQKVEVVNTTACGDSFNAGFLYEYLKTKDMNKALEKGTWCAAMNARSEAPGSIV